MPNTLHECPCSFQLRPRGTSSVQDPLFSKEKTNSLPAATSHANSEVFFDSRVQVLSTQSIRSWLVCRRILCTSSTSVPLAHVTDALTDRPAWLQGRPVTWSLTDHSLTLPSGPGARTLTDLSLTLPAGPGARSLTDLSLTLPAGPGPGSLTDLSLTLPAGPGPRSLTDLSLTLPAGPGPRSLTDLSLTLPAGPGARSAARRAGQHGVLQYQRSVSMDDASPGSEHEKWEKEAHTDNIWRGQNLPHKQGAQQRQGVLTGAPIGSQGKIPGLIEEALTPQGRPDTQGSNQNPSRFCHSHKFFFFVRCFVRAKLVPVTFTGTRYIQQANKRPRKRAQSPVLKEIAILGMRLTFQ